MEIDILKYNGYNHIISNMPISRLFTVREIGAFDKESQNAIREVSYEQGKS